MNARHLPPNDSIPARPRVEQEPPPAAPGRPSRHVHRERDFGVGYGNSSGYGSDRHYVDGHADPIFRFV